MGIELEQEALRISKLPNIRSADRANIRRMLNQVRRGRKLSGAEREELWAYITRYGGPAKR